MRALTLSLVALISCATEPSYEGRLCDVDRACPERYECGADNKCHVQGSLQADASPEADAAPDAGQGDAEPREVETGDAAPGDADNPDVPPVDAGPAVVSLHVAPASISLAAGFTVQLSAEATFADQSTRDVTGEASWSVVDPTIAQVDANGLLRTLIPGATIVEATLDGVTGNAALSVMPAVVVQVETWNKHNLVVKSDGTVWGWGWNELRQLDPIAQNQITAPIRLAIDDVAWVRGGGTMTFAVKRDGSVWSWGGNAFGQLGNGNIGPDSVPAPAPVLGAGGIGTLSGVRDLQAGYNYALALMPDGTVLSWGGNSFGSLGLGGAGNPITPTPALIPGLSDVAAIAAGTYHGVALLEDGSVQSWGYNDYGQIGSGAFTVHTNTPAPVIGLEPVLAIDAGWGHTLALTSDGRVLAWGWNAYRQLGDTTLENRIAPQPVQNQGGGVLTGTVQITAGFTHSYALLDDGTLVSWGNNTFGQLGAGVAGDRGFAAPVISTAGGSFAGTTSCAGGGDHGLLLTNAGEVWVWGTNVNGELANGTFGMGLMVLTPIPVGGL